jgi:hypothetical protein
MGLTFPIISSFALINPVPERNGRDASKESEGLLQAPDHFFIISFRDRSPMLAADHVAFAPSL